MPRSTLTDADVADIRAQVAEGGRSLSEIAEQFGTTKQHVSRLARDEQRQILTVDQSGLVVGAVEAVLDDAGLDPTVDIKAALAMALAEKLDSVRASETAQSAMAAPALARELSTVLDGIRGDAGLGPRLGSLRGEEAILVARELGYPHPEVIDVETFDELESIRVEYHRRRSAGHSKAVGQI